MKSAVPTTSTVYTPERLAAAMVKAVARPARPSDIWLDPCVGDGAFVREISGLGIPRLRILARDLSLLCSSADALATTTRGTDTVAWASAEGACCDRIVMNPPYVPIAKLGTSVRPAARHWPHGGRDALSPRANYWCSFVLAAIRLLRLDGALCVVLPASWDYAQYAAPVRAEVEQNFSHVMVLRCRRPLFPHVLEGAVVVLARGRGRPLRRMERMECDTPAGLIDALAKIGPDASPNAAAVLPLRRPARSTQRMRLGDVCTIRIGGVTGAADYFLMSDDERKTHGLPATAMRPVLTRARHLTAYEMTPEHWQTLSADGERVWLFDPPPAAARHVAVAAYIKQGEKHRGNYKLSRREPWYRTPLPPTPHAFMSGMSRHLPFLVLNSMPRLTATNTLYVVQFARGLDSEDRIGVGLSLLTSASRRTLRATARNYADGLVKFEPGELSNLTLEIGARRIGSEPVLDLATNALLDGDAERASAIADAWLDGMSLRETLQRWKPGIQREPMAGARPIQN